MPSKTKRGRISIVCPYCGYLIEEYSLESEPLKKTNKCKFSGSPIPMRARYQGGEISDGVILCPHCKRPLKAKVYKIIIMNIDEFDKNVVYDMNTNRYVPLDTELVTPVEKMLENSHSIATVDTTVDAPSLTQEENL